MKNKRLILVGGFLGAGKTTLIGKTVRNLQSSGLRCGVITNDQANGLVDTAMAEALDGAKVSEIAGGCFCCKLTELVETLSSQWSRDGGTAPDVIVAEPVGSCTDLMATVLLPLRRAYGDSVTVAPLSVVVDGRRALASLGGRRAAGSFSRDVGYIYRKQIEEAEILVVNKEDLMEQRDLDDLLDRLAREYPHKNVRVLSARTGSGMESWIQDTVGNSAKPEQLMDVDYDRYGVGEALLGWCNAMASVRSDHELDGDQFLLAVANAIGGELCAQSIEIAHFKMALQDDQGRLGIVNQVMSMAPAEISRSFGGTLRGGSLTVNLRAEASPEVLQKAVENCLGENGSGEITAYCRLTELAAFCPGQPIPVERVIDLALEES